MGAWEDFEKRVRLFQLLDTGDVSKEGLKITSQLTGRACEAVSTAISPEDLLPAKKASSQTQGPNLNPPNLRGQSGSLRP